MNTHALNSIDPVKIGERLADSRRARRITQQQAADALGVARTTITALEQGVRRPRAGELLKLAQLYGRQVGDFVRSTPTTEPESFVLHFRSAAGLADALSEEERSSDSQRFEDFCRWYVELEELLDAPLLRRYPEVYDVSDTPPERAALEVAESERNRLGLGDGPIGDLWGLLETDVGLRIFALPMTGAKVGGIFYYSDAYGGCIAVNARHPEGKRRWSVVHEYGHFLSPDRFRPHITVDTERRRVPDHERFADAFARFFLLPESGLVRRFQAMRRAKTGPVTVADVLALAHHYRVSFQAFALRLEELKLLPTGTWANLLQRGFKPDRARKLLPLTPHASDPSGLPLRYELLAAQAFAQELISEGQLARMLATDRVSARERVGQLTQPIERAEDSEWRQVSLDLGAALVGMPG